MPSNILSYGDLITRLEYFKRQIEKCDETHNQAHLFELMKAFRKMIGSVHEEELCTPFFHSEEYRGYKKFFRNHNNYYVRALESTEALSIISKGNFGNENFADLINAEQIQYNYQMKGEDLRAVDFSADKKLVMVGCWPMPETLMFIHQNTPLKNIVGLDNSCEAVFIARQIISSLQMDSIKIELKDGKYYDFKDADIVYIPWFVPEKDKVLEEIGKTGKDSVQIVVRSATYLTKMLYNDVSKNLFHRLQIVDRKVSDSPFITRETLVIEKYPVPLHEAYFEYNKGLIKV